MAKKKIKVEWTSRASSHFQELLGYLHSESEISAALVRSVILEKVEKLSRHPEAFPLDRFKKNNDGRFRALIVYNYRISYYAEDVVIYILRIRHTSREPLEH